MGYNPGVKESHTTSPLSTYARLESREQSGRWHRSSRSTNVCSSFYFGLYFSMIFSVQVLYTFHQIYSQYLMLFMLFNMVLLFHFPFFGSLACRNIFLHIGFVSRNPVYLSVLGVCFVLVESIPKALLLCLLLS